MFSSPIGIHGLVKYGENLTVLITFYSLVKNIYHQLPWVDQHRQSVGFIFSTTHAPGYPIRLVSQSNDRAMCNWSNNCLWEYDRQSIFRVVFACSKTG